MKKKFLNLGEFFKMSSARTRIKIFVEGLGEARGELVSFLAPRTVNMLIRKLPFEGKAVNQNGNVYFPISIRMGVEKGKNLVEPGMLGYWPQADSFCVFYSKLKLYNLVNIVGKIVENLEIFKLVKNGSIIKVEKL